MWILSWKIYKLSKFASFISICGAFTRYAAVVCIANGIATGFAVCAAIGIALHFLAEALNTSKWKKVAIKEGFTARIAAGDVNAGLAVYKAKPCKNTLEFIASYNPQVAIAVSHQTAKK